jgi:REP element-mobilizing transposase RayT
MHASRSITCFRRGSPFAALPISPLHWLAERLHREGCDLHAYALMTNHVHLLVTPQRAESIPRLMIDLGRRYVQYIDSTCRRTGTLWDSRYKSSLIHAETVTIQVRHVAPRADFNTKYCVGEGISEEKQLSLGSSQLKESVTHCFLFRYPTPTERIGLWVRCQPTTGCSGRR